MSANHSASDGPSPSPCPASADDSRWHRDFLRLLPEIERRARLTFRHLAGDARDDAVAEVIANACVAYSRLAQQGRQHAATAKSLAWYGVRQYRDGRRTGTPLNVRDVLSERARSRKGLHVERLDRFDERDGVWREVLVEDSRATPPDLAASRIDFPAWLRTLPRRDRRIALTLAQGEPTGRVARPFRLSAGRISQLRRQLMESWHRFVGDEPAIAKAGC